MSHSLTATAPGRDEKSDLPKGISRLQKAPSGHDQRFVEPDLTRAASDARRTEERIEPELLLLVKGQAPIRRTLAALAGRFVFNHCWERLGFARLADYGTERLGLSARTLYDLAHTDRALAELPEIDRAFVHGELPWTKVRLLACVASAGDENSWLARARGLTSAALAKEVRAADVGSVERGGAGGAAEHDGKETWENVKIRCTSPVQGKWHRARQLAWRMAGRPVKPWECGEMVAAEVLSAIEIEPGVEDVVGEKAKVVQQEANAVAKVGEARRVRQDVMRPGQEVEQAGHKAAQLEVPNPTVNRHTTSMSPAAEKRVMSSASPAAPVSPDNSSNSTTEPVPIAAVRRTSPRGLGPMRSKWTTPELPPYLQSLLSNLDEADAFELDARLRQTVALDQRLDAEIGEILALVAHEQLYLYHGFRNMEDYAREHLGMAAGKARTLLRLERASEMCPPLTAAYREGLLSWVQAGALAPVVLIPHGHFRNREAWVEWATQISVRRLKEDVEWALLLNKTHPERFAATGGLPVEAGYGGDRADALATAARTTAGCITPGGASSGGTAVGSSVAGGTTAATDSPGCSDRQIGAQPRVSEEDTVLFFHAPSSVARLFRAVLCTVRRRIERQTGKSPAEGEAFEAMLDHVFEVWGGQGQRTPAAHRVFERDGWRCTAPGCSSLTNLHDHHIVFRSAGGSNELGNRTTLCVWHHLRGVHKGIVRCMGRAPHELRFELGVRPGRRPLLGFESGDRRIAESTRW